MARKTKSLVIEADNRDAGKVFELTEMFSDQGERWALRVGFALMNAGIDLPVAAEDITMEIIAQVGFRALSHIPYEVAGPLLEELMTCAKYVSPAGVATDIKGNLQIEEISTRLKLKAAVFELLTGFSLPAMSSTGVSSPSAISAG